MSSVQNIPSLLSVMNQQLELSIEPGDCTAQDPAHDIVLFHLQS